MQIENIDGKKFRAMVDGGEAHILYRRGPENSYNLIETLVPVKSRGKNVADQLVREALQTARAENVKVIATCPYVKRWFEKHPEEQSILLKIT